MENQVKNCLRILGQLITSIFSIIFVALTLTLYLFFNVVRQIVNVVMKTTVPDYGAILTPEEYPWSIETVSKNIINTVYLIKYSPERSKTKSFYDSMKDLIDEQIFKQPENFLKLCGTRHQYFGYEYFRKNTFGIDECLKKLDEDVIDEEDFKKYMSKTSNLPLPKNHTALWDVTIGTKPIKWHGDLENKDLYPLVMRFHHMLGDGWSLINFFIGVFADAHCRTDILVEKVLKPVGGHGNAQKNTGISHALSKLRKTVAHFLMLLLKSLEIVVRQKNLVLRNKGELLFEIKNFTGKKIACWSTEEKEELVPLCRKMRRELGSDTKFSAIVFAAVGKSLSSHFQKRMKDVPAYISAMITILLNLPKTGSKVVFKNHFTTAKIALPTKPEYSMIDSVKTFEDTEETKMLIENAQINYLLMHYILGVLPRPILRFFINLYKVPIAMTNIPAPATITILNGCEAVYTVWLPPNWGYCGITFCITTYRNRFQIGLLVDEGVISKREEVQLITDNILESFRKLNDEVL